MRLNPPFLTTFDIHKRGFDSQLDHCSPLGKSDHCVLSFSFQCMIDFVVLTVVSDMNPETSTRSVLRDTSKLFQRYLKRSIWKSKRCKPTMEQIQKCPPEFTKQLHSLQDLQRSSMER